MSAYQCPRGRYLYLDVEVGSEELLASYKEEGINAPGGVIYIWTLRRQEHARWSYRVSMPQGALFIFGPYIAAAAAIKELIKEAKYQCPRGRYLYLDKQTLTVDFNDPKSINAPGGVIYIWTVCVMSGRGRGRCINAPGGVIYIWTQ